MSSIKNYISHIELVTGSNREQIFAVQIISIKHMYIHYMGLVS